ncbi:hypothetical protein [Planctomonas psychrotolerans]|uniref:hypothetical protein n=1 Tax=Planctomonas psychrotolerans TaxID=2528712 RepID=UPI001D0D7A14|nr:hypothetical protein [Planctomonas psychrotolerans]
MNIVGYIVSFGLFIVGVYLFAAAFSFEGIEGYVFFAGIMAVSAALFIPAHILQRVDK